MVGTVCREERMAWGDRGATPLSEVPGVGLLDVLAAERDSLLQPDRCFLAKPCQALVYLFIYYPYTSSEKAGALRD